LADGANVLGFVPYVVLYVMFGVKKDAFIVFHPPTLPLYNCNERVVAGYPEPLPYVAPQKESKSEVAIVTFEMLPIVTVAKAFAENPVDDSNG
jgi:hypothetical protein